MKLAIKVLAVACLSGALTASAETYTPHRLSEGDVAVVRQFVAAETMLPDRTRVQAIAAATTPDGVISACGYTSWIDGSGLYSPYVPFHGVLADNVHGQRVFVVVGLARTTTQFLAIEKLCANHNMQPGREAPAEAKPPAKVAKLIEAARELNRRCRGSEGADPSSTVCDKRNAAFDKVNDAGWCYGKKHEAGYQHEWHQCVADSNGR